MASRMAIQSGRGYLTSRSIAFAGIVALHALAIMVALTVRGPRPDVVALPSLQVSILAQAQPDRPPPPKIDIPDIVVPPPVIPLVTFALPAAPMAITLTPPPAAPPATPAPAPVMAENADVPVEVSEPDYVQMPRPVYPAAARRARAQGVVHVRALVDTDGRAREVHVHRSSGFTALDKAACDSVQEAIFKPYRQNGVARSMLVIVPVSFTLTDPRAVQRNARDDDARATSMARTAP